MRLVHEAVWKMTGPEDYQETLTALAEGLQALRIPFQGCGIYLMDPECEPPAVLCQYSWADGRWCQSVAAEDRDAALAIWHTGEVYYGEDLLASDPHGQLLPLERRFGHAVRAALHVPFTTGVLTVTSPERYAFSVRDVEILKEIAESLPGLFQRMEDLRELESRDRQLERAQQLELVGQLAAGTAHEINNALTVILGQCELLLLDELDPSVRESLDIMLRAGEHTRVIVSRLLDLARGQELKKQPTNLNQLVTDTLNLIRRQLHRDRVQLREELAPDLSLVQVQPGQVQQVLINLVQNSRDALTGMGRGSICVRTRREGSWAVLEVEDDGPGIPAALHDRVFEPFFTTKGRGKGTGLGLSVCRNIAHQHGGHLHLDPCLRGTRMVLSLPAADTAALTALN
ncbi:MAG: ATP-binding protein [Gemmatimonadota bacterium]